MKRSEGNRLMSARFRKDYANRLLNLPTVAAAIDERAMQGHLEYRVAQEYPFNLSETDAAKALMAWLKTEQFQHTWQPTYREFDPLRPSKGTEYPELVITW